MVCKPFDYTDGDHKYVSPLCHAVYENDYDNLKALLDAGWDPDSREWHLRTPLMLAAERGDIDMVRLLLRHGACVRGEYAVDSDDWGVMRFAAIGGAECVKALLEAGADPNGEIKKGERGDYPLAVAKDAATAALLIGAGAEIDSHDRDDLTPLYHAVLNRNTGVAEFLIRNGADPNHGSGLPLKCLVGIKGKECRHSTRNFEYRKLDESDAKKLLGLLLDAGAVIDLGNPLACAAAVGNMTTCRLLAEAGAVVTPESTIAAGKSGYIECADILLAHGASPKVIAESAAKHGREQLVLEIVGKFRDTGDVLHKAFAGLHFDLARRLLDGDLDPNGRDSNGSTALCVMLSQDRRNIAGELDFRERHGGISGFNERQKRLFQFFKIEMPKFLNEMAGRGMDIELPNASGRTPLWLAARNGWDDVVIFLLKHGADANRIDAGGMPILHAACLSRFPEAIKYLAHFGADMGIRDGNGDTAPEFLVRTRNDFDKLIYLKANGCTDLDFKKMRRLATERGSGILELLDSEISLIDSFSDEELSCLRYEDEK